MPTTPPTLYHRGCITCASSSKHEPEWISDPKVSDPERSRTFVLCFDGTGDSPDDDDSNVLQFVATLKDDPKVQVVYYQSGIGTSTNNVIKTPASEAAVKLTDQMFAYSLDEHIKEGYKFLMHNYQAGDKICIFGFSRGAYTARALAGVLQKIGLLPPSKFDQLKSAYAMYVKDDEDGRSKSAQFKQTSIDVKVEFLGVWDTVESVGVGAKSLPFSGSNNTIKVFRHALALDEHRAMFIPTFCTGGKPRDQQANTDGMVWDETDVKEVFFAGAHCDVGGGSVKNGTRNSLARIPLRWMIRECFKAHTGIIFDAHMLKNGIGFDIESMLEAPKPLSSNDLPSAAAEPQSSSWTSVITAPALWVWNKLPQIRTPPPPPPRVLAGEAQEEHDDSLSKIYDQLEIHPFWQPMEKLRLITKKQHGDANGPDDPESDTLVPNLGQGRVVHRPVMERDLKVHRSVKARILNCRTDGEYLPRIRCAVTGEQKPRLLTKGEWLADEPKHFVWVD